MSNSKIPNKITSSNAKKWHEDDDFWETMAPMLFKERYWNDAPLQVEQIIKLLKIKPGAHILDLCCGPGRHTLELARRSFKVTGVDRTKLYIDKVRRQAKKENLEIELIQEDMRYFKRPNTFDYALNLYTSFGYFEDQKEDERVVKNLYQSLKSGGKLVMDMMGKEVLARIFRERRWDEENGITFLQESKLNDNWGWIQNRWILLKGMERREFYVSHRLYSGVELSSLLLRCGFKSVKLFGDLTGAPYDHTAQRLVALAVK